MKASSPYGNVPVVSIAGARDASCRYRLGTVSRNHGATITASDCGAILIVAGNVACTLLWYGRKISAVAPALPSIAMVAVASCVE